MTRTLVLASRSPRRRALLEEAIREDSMKSGGAFSGMVLRIEPPRGDEAPPLPDEPPADHARSLARAKAEDVAARLARELGPGDVVLGADTVVDLGG